MANIQNPFFFGNEVYDDDFCNRVAELQELKQDVNNGINLLLYAPRRFGKTSLLKKLQNDLSMDSDYMVVYFDIFTVSSVDEFIQRYFNILAKSFESTTDKIVNLFKNILKIRPNITMNISSNSEITYGMTLTKKEQNQTLEEILNIPYLYAKKFNKKVVVIFDEFQEVEQLDIEKKLRSVIQTHSRNVSYLFSGSKKSILSQMFDDKNRAFYKSIKHFYIKEILLEDWIVFIQDKFDSTDKYISIEQIQKIFEVTNGFPYYMQQLMYGIWEAAAKDVTRDIVDNSIKLMLERESDIYSTIWTNLTPNQKRTLKYIAYNDGRNLYSNSALSEANLSATTLKSTLEALMKKDICDKKGDKYYFIDPFMKYWLENIT